MNFVFFPPIGWDYPMRQRPQHLARALALLGHEVTYVDVDPAAKCREVARRLNVYAPEPGAKWRRMLSTLSRPVDVMLKGVRVAYSATPDPELVNWLSGLPRPLTAIIESPAFAPLASILHEQKACVVYDRLDDWSSFPNAPVQWAAFDQELLREADVIWATCEALREGVDRAVLIPNGFERERFSAPRGKEDVILPGSPPRALYAGTLAEWFDFDLLYEVAWQLPDVSWIIAGQFHETEGALPEPVPYNVFWMGPVPYDDLGGIYRACDIGIIPFKDIPLCRSVDPVKAYEYLAASLPVVATHLPILKGFPGTQVVNDRESFISAIRHALATPYLPDDVPEFLRGKTWQDRAQAAIQTLEIPGI